MKKFFNTKNKKEFSKNGYVILKMLSLKKKFNVKKKSN